MPETAVNPNASRSERLTAETLTCGHCRAPFRPLRDKEYCQNSCRIAAWNEHSHHGKVVSARRVTSGEWSIVVRMKRDIGLTPGQTVRIGNSEPARHLSESRPSRE